jgi:hypothetical protein
VRLKTHRASRLLLVTLATLLLATSSFAMVREVSFRELTTLSDATIEVVVTRSYAQWNDEHTAIFTHYVVEPLRQVGGRPRGASFELLFAGGRTDDGRQMIVTEVPQLEVGGQYILFLHSRETRHASPTVGMWQGALRVVRDARTQELAVVDAAGHLIERDANGELHRGRNVVIDREGVMTTLAAEPEGAMEADPILTGPDGKPLPLIRAEKVAAQATAERTPVSPDTLMNLVDEYRRQMPRSNQ